MLRVSSFIVWTKKNQIQGIWLQVWELKKVALNNMRFDRVFRIWVMCYKFTSVTESIKNLIRKAAGKASDIPAF